MSDPRIIPQAVAQEVDLWIDKQIEDAINFVNSEPLDESGAWSLHALAARIYAAGFSDGERVTDQRLSAEHRRAKARAKLSGDGSSE